MVTTVTTHRPKARRNHRGTGSGSNGQDRSGGNGSGSPSRRLSESYRLGMWLALASILMLFVSLTSAYIVRQGFSDDWRPIRAPIILWFNTGLLVLSSLTLEMARRSLNRGLLLMFTRWLTTTVMLGMVFLVGQFLAWRQLAGQGIYVSTNPHSSFFYLLTGAHGLHLLGGVVALLIIAIMVWGQIGFPTSRRKLGSDAAAVAARVQLRVDVTSIYWHFMDGLWLYLVALLFVWR